MSAHKAKWTILTYIAAHNNLEELGKRSWRQISEVGSTRQVINGVLFDGPNGASRYIFGDPGKQLLKEDFADFDSGDPQRLVETATWLFEKYPAENYGLVLWSHGTGWRPERGQDVQRGGPPPSRRYGSTWQAEELEKIAAEARGDNHVDLEEAEKLERSFSGNAPPVLLFRSSLKEILKKDKKERAICFDDGTGHSLDAIELERVIAQIVQTTNQPLDLLGMDACLMATLEVAYQVRSSVAYLVASEELVPGTSWPYDTILGELRSNPGLTARDLALSAVKHYYNYYKSHPPSLGDVTKVALDLSKIEELTKAVNDLGQALVSDMDSQADVLWKAQKSTSDKETNGRWNTKFLYHLWDLGSLAAFLAADEDSSTVVQEAAANVSAALKKGKGAVLDERHYGDWFKGIGGVSVYFMPPQKQRISPDYGRVALSIDTSWDEMLAEYHTALS